MPVLVGLDRLLEASALAGVGVGVPASQDPGVFQDPIDGRGADGEPIGVEHHVGQPAVAFAGMAIPEVQNHPFLLVAQPEISRDPGVVLVDLAVAILPLVELAAADADPLHDPAVADAGPFAPVAHVIDDRIADVGLGPGIGQPRPSVFFRRTCSAMISAMTSSLEARRALS